TTPDRTRREPPSERVREVREQMDEAYQTGLDAYRAGRFDEAKEYFDRAVDVVLSSDIDLGSEPALRKAFDEMVKDIADLDAELYARDASSGDDSGSPLDELKDITTYLSPDEAEKERQRIQRVVGEISYDIPVVLNPKVLALIEAFQTRLRKEFEAGLKRSGAYLPMIKRIFKEEGLPEDLAYMAHQESAFKNNAYSRARAKGMWQFMSFTGRKYGLKRDVWVDERSDFEKSTRAAAAYLKELYARYGDWYLAMAAYNAGEGKIDRAIRRARSRDYWKLARTNYIRRETKYYVPAILASILVDKSPADYGFDVDIDRELRWDTVELDHATDLQVIADATGSDLDTIRALNPELRGLVTPLNADRYEVRVPEGTRGDLKAKLKDLPDDQRISWTVHETRRGESFSGIARRYHVPLRALLDANPRYAHRRLRAGVSLNVPLGGRSPAEAMAVASREDRPSYESGERIVHRVRRGENLQRIAWKYRTTVANLKRWNSLRGSLIRPGQRLIAYYGEKGAGPQVDYDASSSTVTVSDGRLQYRVQRGDTLWSIARKFNSTVDDLCRWNGLDPKSTLRQGDRLLIGEEQADGSSSGRSGPSRTGAIRHRVRRGENLYRIAQKYDVTVSQVRAWNDLGGRSTIYPGQILTILAN
ncbi:MAG TPA: LysM peptidoglycan-binding domain-containing protein, partial [Candidatus Polarisedimenticolia bacterium]|nr:LysM peptidoglycan-binding domain-containing protein [Candidatus Polarisedimenticolia bacterium]